MDFDTAREFGEAVVAGNFADAHLFLTREARRRHSVADICEDVENMIAYAEEPLRRVDVMSEQALYDWPEKQPDDIAIVFVALSGDHFVEGVSLTLTNTKDGVRIRELEWGRP